MFSSIPNSQRNIYTILLLFATTIAFSPILFAAFINYDDPQYIVENDFIRNNSLQSFIDILKGKPTILYVPFTILSFKLDFALFGLNAKGYHFLNLIFHLSNIYILSKILRELNLKGLFVYYPLLFFSISPLVSESVCWITERKDVLYCFFYFLSILNFIRYNSTKNKINYILALLFFTISCFSKPMAVSLPAVLLLYLHYQDKRKFKEHLLKISPFILLSIFFAAIAYIKINSYDKEITDYEKYDHLDKMYLIISEIGYYFFKPLFPSGNQFIHLFPEKQLLYLVGSIRFFFLLGFSTSVVIIYRYFKHKDLITILLFFMWLVLILPVLQIVPNTHSYVSERYFYVSLVFPLAITLRFLNKQKHFFESNLVYFGIMILFIYLSFNRSKQWKNSETLFTHELKVNANCHIALNNLAMYYNNKSDFNKSFPLLKKATVLEPKNPIYLNNYGWCLAGLGFTDSAIVYFNKSLVYKPKNFEALNNLGVGYASKNELDKALYYFVQAEKLNPNNKRLLLNISGIYSKKKDNKLAKKYFLKAKQMSL